VLYYFLFRFVIVKWNLHTPGREVDGETADLNNVLVDQPEDVVTDPITRNDGKTKAPGEKPAPTPVG